MPTDYLLGIDIGQTTDPTAFALAKHTEPVSLWDQPSFDITHLDRMLKVAYPDQVERVVKLCTDIRARQQKEIQTGDKIGDLVVILDATGVGRAICDMFRRSALRQMKVRVIPVTFTSGHQAHQLENGYWGVPKKDLAAALAIMMESARLRISKRLEHAKVLEEEIRNFHIKTNIATGYDAFEAWREGDHDDLVLAVAMICWYGHRNPKYRKLAYEPPANQFQRWKLFKHRIKQEEW